MLNTEQEVLERLLTQLDDLELRAEFQARDDRYPDHVITLTHGRSSELYHLEITPAVKPSAVPRLARFTAHSEATLLGIGSVVTPPVASMLGEAGLQYVDVAGNARIRFGDVRIDVQGRRPAKAPKQRLAPSTGNLFSAARAQVIFALLEWPDLWRESQRAVADTAGVSVGQAHSALTLLREVGFGPGGHRRTTDLLDQWVTAFPTGLGEKIVLARFRGEIADLRTDGAGGPVYMSGEVAASELVRPLSAVLYVEELESRMVIKNRWRSDGDPNIVLRRAFWSTPPYENAGHHVGPGFRSAPAVLVFADLVTHDDPRVRASAEEWRQRIAGPDRHS
ncbi:type IV toxin-antitoxin system AbiEi family antitoxin [Nocardioides exalbidus]|nr:type IV toxin-antitoxin system AbiEi family antitoxin [Nocardioides exalbidus]